MTKVSKGDQVATKKDIDRIEKSLRRYSTKSELRRVEKSLRGEILKIEVRTERVEEKVDILDKKLDRIENKLDGFAGNVDNLVKENAVGADQYREHDVKIKDHEVRITTLESI